jgi:hypothetical protein
MVGVAHHISNRVAILSGISDLLANNTTIPPAVLQALATEVPKLEEAVRLFRLLPTPDETPEAIEPIRLVHDAIALATLHPGLKNITYTTDGGTNAQPVLVHPVACTHEILMAIVHAATEHHGDSLCISLNTVGDTVVITAGHHTVAAPTLLSARQPTPS